jgi:hypothetical protein
VGPTIGRFGAKMNLRLLRGSEPIVRHHFDDEANYNLLANLIFQNMRQTNGDSANSHLLLATWQP